MLKVKNVAEGVRVVCFETDKYKTAEISVSMILPLDENAAANAICLNLLRRSSSRYPDFSLLNRKLDELYGAYLFTSVGKCGDAQHLNLSISCLDDKFSLDGVGIIEQAVNLVDCLIFEPNIKNKSFGKENVKAEKREIINTILEEMDDKRLYANRCLIRNMCSEEPYGLEKYGTVKDVKAVKMSDIYAAWKRIISNARFQITCVGSVNPEKIFSIFENRFKNIYRETCNIDTVFIKKSKRLNRIEEKFPVNQGKLVIGYRTGMKHSDDKIFAEKVMADILGGGTYSRLFSIIREKLSLCYYCRASLISKKGIVIIDCGIDSDKEKVVFDEITNQINELSSGNFDEDIIASSKKSIHERMTFYSPDSICDWYSSQIIDKKILSPEQFIEKINKVTKDDVIRAAKNLSIDTLFMLSGSEKGE